MVSHHTYKYTFPNKHPKETDLNKPHQTSFSIYPLEPHHPKTLNMSVQKPENTRNPTQIFWVFSGVTW